MRLYSKQGAVGAFASCCFACLMLTGSAVADELIVDLAGWQTYGAFKNVDNSGEFLDIGAGSQIVSVEYEVDFTSYDPSWKSEFTLSLNNTNVNDSSDYWDWAPSTDEEAGDFTGSGSFSDPGIDGSGPFSVLDDGVLWVTVYDSFGTGSATPYAEVSSGTLTITYNAVPEPSMLAICGLFAGIPLFRRSRRKTA